MGLPLYEKILGMYTFPDQFGIGVYIPTGYQRKDCEPLIRVMIVPSALCDPDTDPSHLLSNRGYYPREYFLS